MTEPALIDEPTVAQIMDRRTGEIIDLAHATVEELGTWLDGLREAEQIQRSEKSAVHREIHRRMDADVTWTLRSATWKLTGQSPTLVTYDAEKLHQALAELVEEDLIPQAALEAAVEVKPTYSARVSGINKLQKLGGTVADVIERCAQPKDPARRRVTLSRIGEQ